MNNYFLTIFALSCLGLGEGKAQYTILHNFNGVNGKWPYGSLTLSGNTLFGMATYGGAYDTGCIFSIDTNGSGYKDLLDFNGSNGAIPTGSLVISGNVLYGMTQNGGLNGVGNIFSIHIDGSGYKDLLNFNGTNGQNPEGSLTLYNNKLYGMTFEGGGISGFGNIFSIDTNGAGFKDLHDFNFINGGNPRGSLTISLSGNVLYGMTSEGASANSGNIFSIDSNGNNFNDLLDFNDTNGADVQGSLVLLGYKLYGMTTQGGSNSLGVVFSLDTDGVGYKDIFDFNGTNGEYPLGSLTQVGNKLYGMTSGGGTNHSGCIFSIDTNGSSYKDLFYFNSLSGAYPYNSLTYSTGILYGMTYQGGRDSDGVIFKIDSNSTLSINELNLTLRSINLYPNPNSGIFTISFVGAQNLVPANIEIYNMLGEKLYTETLRSAQGGKLINLSGQPSGVYFYRVINENSDLIGEGKFVINH
ncbi:MAG TPA: T9SS type A sorting domain-containing protein [Bacteroidia bacterium]|jgi:uncharacterized repeat protein (TIGR03803 family)|nr:T9SS type A sorting domain-containing protein [Bacteroidia bacterium]